ncbi:MAG: amino acid adenylation domain-containing protein, partial [Fischerella sp. CENA71]|nr:amino acid adenylation domain-containing protein [Fischerella sp. CENA71]
QLFEEQVKRTPNAVAVKYDGQQLTYQKLNERANQLAHHLMNLGVRPETPVAISVQRSLDLVIGMLGIFKIGGVYVPIDPIYPDERCSWILNDTHAPILLTHAALKGKYSYYQGHLVSLDADWKTIATQSSENPERVSSLNHLAYLTYTSGSTGKPKGVMCTHLGLTNRLLWTLEAYPITAEDSLLQVASIGFDISVWEMLFPLLAGGQLVIALPERHKDAAYLVDVIVKEHVSVVHFVPSLLDTFLEYPNLEDLSHLKQVICGGEALSVELKNKFFQKLKAKLYHAYGPTETSISVTHWDCQQQTCLDKVPLGRPIANTKIYILDHHQQPVPVGVVGELYIGGASVARGYLNRPDLTAEKFLPDPFSTQEGSRLYKTGDLALFLPDGNIEFIGRSDNQVKLRGYRVELGEIESVLSEHELVRQAVVLCREDITGDKRLIAYVKSVDDVHEGELAHQRIRLLNVYLANKLPEYMVPSRFVLLDAFPLMANGKIDQKAL